MELTAENLNYDRAATSVGIVHLGVGAYHRAHQAVYVDRLLSTGVVKDWALRGIELLASSRPVVDALNSQDCLYTVTRTASDGSRDVRVVGSIREVLLAPDDPEAALEAVADPQVRIVTMTITEGGYSPDTPAGTFTFLAEALRRRRERGTGGLTIASCDNLLHNGDRTRDLVHAAAQELGEGLVAWIEREVTFPNSMVDGITPRTTPAERERLCAESGFDDAAPVVAEPWVQWVVEDRFAAGRPPLEEVGVLVVEDVEPYELLKLRLLNAGHQVLAFPGHLLGHRSVHTAAADPLLARFLLDYMEIEATPILRVPEGFDLDAYRRSLLDRFANPHTPDTIARLATDTSDRIPTFLLPVVFHQLATGGDLRRCATVVACWARYAEGVDEDGNPILVDDRRAQSRTAAARAWREDDLAFLRDTTLFGDLAERPRFVEAYRWALTSLHERGVRATLTDLV